MDTEKYKKFDHKSALEFADIARNVFAPIYPVIAGQIMERYGERTGVCIDVGSGVASLAIALARISDLKIYSLDFSDHILAIAKENLRDEGMLERIDLVLGDVHYIPFEKGVADLITSRGSLIFWKDQKTVFKEFYRVLKPGGMGYIGGGAGSAELYEKVGEEMQKRRDGWKGRPPRKSGKKDKERMEGFLKTAGFKKYHITMDDSGFWVYFLK